MATFIPLSGELAEVPPPRDEVAVRGLLGSPGTQKLQAPDGSTWWEAQPFVLSENERATRFYNARCGSPGGQTLHGDVLYLSADETRIMAGTATKDDYVPVRGRTFDVKEKLKAIGARWYPEEKTWKVPKALLPEAEAIVRKGA